LVVFGSVLAEQIGIPIPAIPFLLAAGAAAGTGKLSLVLLLLLSGSASLMADMVWYFIGRLGGAKVLGWLCRISLQPHSRLSCPPPPDLLPTAWPLSSGGAQFHPRLHPAPPAAGRYRPDAARPVRFLQRARRPLLGRRLHRARLGLRLPARDRRRLRREVRQ